MKGTRNADKNVRKFITIRDERLWQQIDRLMTLPRYAKSFNKVVNDALDFGLPELIKSEFGEVEELSEHTVSVAGRTNQTDGEFYGQVIRLLKEIIINETVNKSVLCSLFESKRLELNGKPTSANAFEKGVLQDTPQFLQGYELRALKALRE